MTFRLRPDDPAAVRERLEGCAAEAAGEPAAGAAERRVDLQESERRSRRTPDRGCRTEGPSGGRRALLGAPCELHRERRPGAGGRCAGTDGDRPAGGVGAEWDMAGARGAARRQLVSRALRRRNRLRREWTWPRVPWRAVLGLAPFVAVAIAVPRAWQVVRTHPYFAVREVMVHHRGRLPAEQLRSALHIAPGTPIWEVDTAGAEARATRAAVGTVRERAPRAAGPRGGARAGVSTGRHRRDRRRGGGPLLRGGERPHLRGGRRRRTGATCRTSRGSARRISTDAPDSGRAQCTARSGCSAWWDGIRTAWARSPRCTSTVTAA